MKDVMVLYEMGFPAIAFSSETIPIKGTNGNFVLELVKELKERFEHVMLFLDNDTTGKTETTKLCRHLNIKSILIPDKEPKDISDYVQKHNLRKAKKLVKKLISKTISKTNDEFLEFAESLPGNLHGSNVVSAADGSGNQS